MGHDGPGRVRADRDDGASGQRARAAGRPWARWGGRCPGYDVVLADPVTGELRAEGPADGELCLRLDSPRAGPAAGPDGRLPRRRRAHRRGDARRRLPHRRRRLPGRRRLHHLHRAGGRRLQGLRLPDQPLRARERARGAPGGRGGRGRAVAGPAAARGAEGVRRAGRRLASRRRRRRRTSSSYCRENLAPYKRIRRIEFAELPKTISGKIRRVELRESEHARHPDGAGERSAAEFWEDDLRCC